MRYCEHVRSDERDSDEVAAKLKLFNVNETMHSTSFPTPISLTPILRNNLCDGIFLLGKGGRVSATWNRAFAGGGGKNCFTMGMSPNGANGSL